MLVVRQIQNQEAEVEVEDHRLRILALEEVEVVVHHRILALAEAVGVVHHQTQALAEVVEEDPH